MADKLLTVFSPGSYGTYLSWAVYSYSNLNTGGIITKPFGASGSAHLYRQSTGFKIVLPSHKIIPGYEDMIFIHPSNFLDYFNNQYAKQCEFDDLLLLNGIFSEFDEKIKTHWGVSEAAKWQEREFWSFFLPEMFAEEKRRFNKYRSELADSNVLDVSSEDILYSHIEILRRIYSKFKLEQTVDDAAIHAIHSEYMLLQQHNKKTVYIAEIVEACLSKQDLNINQLSLYDEAMIQHLFRCRGIDMRCYNLNEFPKTTLDLYNVLDLCTA
jgi:hypothetical protein